MKRTSTIFKRGDTVILGRGALPMTVLQVLADNTVWVEWSDRGTRHTGRFELWRLRRLYGW